MKKNVCVNETCDNEVREGFKYCLDCYNKWKQENPETKKGQWHDDPVVDQLMKMNANMGKVVRVLEEWKK